jgi:ribonuclease VapC
LDASVVLAFVLDEPGAEEAETFLDNSLISTVNLTEVLQKAAQYGLDPSETRTTLSESGVGIVPFDDRMAERVASLWNATRPGGLSLADRACVTLAEAVNGIAVTTDRAWARIDLPGLPIHIITR